MIKSTFLLMAVAGILLAVSGLSTLIGSEANQYTPFDKAFYLSAEDGLWIRPGLKLRVLDASIGSDRKPVVTVQITDGKDQPLDRDGILSPGPVSFGWIIAYLPSDAAQYINYNLRTVTSPITNATATQPTTDSGGKYVSAGNGTYTYTFNTTLPANYDRTTTHTIGVYATRDMVEFGLPRNYANVLQSFVPDGRQVIKVREVVATANCNQCHNPLALHGGSRRETGLCILCHQTQNSDPDTGNTVDFKVMVHKIHRGENLPSVKAGNPYQIIGFGQSVHDYSTVAFPRDIRSCATCHKNASQAANYLLNPTRSACGSCHDDVNFGTGANHPGGPQANDSRCASCHWPEGDYEYDASISGAHTVPYKSMQLRRPKFEILNVSNGAPGQKPTVQFKVTDKDGNAIVPSTMSRLRLTLAGPTSEYKWYVRESAIGAKYADGIATYTFAASLPADASGTYSVGMEGFVNTTLNQGTTKQFVRGDAGDNVVKEFAVTGSLVSRRVVVDVAKCNQCHEKLLVHTLSRNDTKYCVGCHNPTFTDAPGRPSAEAPAESLHFKILIHKIHSGEDLNNDFTVYDEGKPDNFNEVRFPGDRRDCTTCHVGTTYTLPLPKGVLSSSTPRNYWNPTLPAAAACLGCHDSIEAAAHALINTASIGESCSVCHKEGAEFAVTKVHAR